MTIHTPKFVDLDFNFMFHPRTHDVTKKTDVNAILQSLKNLIKTKNFESPFHPEIGCQVNSLLFEGNTTSTKSSMERSIKYVIGNFEPRVELIDVIADSYEKQVSIELTFKILQTDTVYTANFNLERIL